jgi:uncharacterized membrane protein YgcG
MRWDVILLLLFVGFIITLASCSDDCDDVKDRFGESSNEYRQCRDNQGSGSHRSSSGSSYGSSYGGYNSGGYHK